MEVEKWESISEKEYLEFDRIPKEERYSAHPDLCALIYLEKHGKLKKGDAITASGYDIAYIGCEIDDISEKDALYLIRCGVHVDEQDGLALFT